MILAFDTFYFDNQAKTVCVTFNDWNSSLQFDVFSETIKHSAAYTPGEFYKRELPCILSLLKAMNPEQIEAIIIDGFVFLDDDYKLGLGGHLYNHLEQKIPVIGVAKTNFASIDQLKRPLLRGKSANPLYITAIGIDVDEALEKIRNLDGEFRIPTILKTLDGLTKA
ncbi:endonuclease V [Fluviicola sp.]|uniref:endonuclease V n=1 Tax=Fluviicola sp. TaxID=1917219 RepID=UPI0031D5DAC8